MAGRLAVIGAGLMGPASPRSRRRPAGRSRCGTWTTPPRRGARTASGIRWTRSRPRGRSRRTRSRRAGPDHHDHRPGRGSRGRHRGRGGVRAARDQAGRVPRAGPDLQGRTRCWRTNTSAIPVTQIAAVTDRPESVVGTHFFSPVPMMKLCELVRGYKTSDETLAAARAFAEEIGKTCIVVNRDIAGFVTTRLIAALVVEAVKLVESGVVSRRGPGHGLQARLRPRHGPAGHHRPDRRRRAAARHAEHLHRHRRTRSSSRRSCSSGWSPPATWAARPARASTRTDMQSGTRRFPAAQRTASTGAGAVRRSPAVSTRVAASDAVASSATARSPPGPGPRPCRRARHTTPAWPASRWWCRPST